MRAVPFVVLSVIFTVVVVSRGEAQTALPEISVSPLPPSQSDLLSSAGAVTGDGKKQGAPALDRLNKQLKRTVDETNPSEIDAPIDARSSDLKKGVGQSTCGPAAVREEFRTLRHSVPAGTAARLYISARTPLGSVLPTTDAALWWLSLLGLEVERFPAPGIHF